MRIRWTRAARRDLDHVRAWIEQDAPDSAMAVAERILDGVRHLAVHRGLGRPGRVAGTRELVVPNTPFIIPYRVSGATVQLLRVLHGARRWPRRL